jgi:heme/copper-type cytochrome/quinol oxidase subunit 3
MRDRGQSLRHVRAAQLRARARRGAIGRIILGMVFLVGALAYARAPDRHSRSSILWMTGLLVLSTAYVALGVRTLSRVRRRGPKLWVAAALLWGVLATVVIGFLLRGS